MCKGLSTSKARKPSDTELALIKELAGRRLEKLRNEVDPHLAALAENRRRVEVESRTMRMP